MSLLRVWMDPWWSKHTSRTPPWACNTSLEPSWQKKLIREKKIPLRARRAPAARENAVFLLHKPP